MKRIVFKHIRNTHNVGDFACCPLDYLHFENAVAMDLDEPTPICDAVVFGGGKIFGSLASKMTLNDKLAKHRIAWGVSTIQSSIFSFRYRRSSRSMNLVGSRDYGDSRYEYAPCITCLSPLFDKNYETIHDVVFYLHKTKSQSLNLGIPSTVPVLDNYCKSMEEAVNFIGSGDIVVSNSYHGVYWALLLGKKVLCLPFSNKFNHYRLVPGYSAPQDWKGGLKNAVRQIEMRDICRAASFQFERKVRNIF
jgi:hypothetical protein